MSIGNRKRLKRVALAIGILSVVLWVLYRLTMPGLLFLLRFLDIEDEHVAFRELDTKNETIHPNGRTLRLHLYQPRSGYDHVYLVVHGVHHGGYDEERMVGFSKQLARFTSPATSTRALITPLINHVELEEGASTPFTEYVDIIRFWTELLRR